MNGAGAMGPHTGEARFDWNAVLAYRDRTVETLRRGVGQLMQAGKVALVQGTAQVAEEGVILCGGERYEAADIVIAAGAAPALPPIPGRELPGVYTSDGLLEGDGRLPASLVIIGGGVIGVELASAYAGVWLPGNHFGGDGTAAACHGPGACPAADRGR